MPHSNILYYGRAIAKQTSTHLFSLVFRGLYRLKEMKKRLRLGGCARITFTPLRSRWLGNIHAIFPANGTPVRVYGREKMCLKCARSELER